MNDYDIMNLKQAGAQSRTTDSIMHVILYEPTPAEEIVAELQTVILGDEDYDWTTNGDILEFWAFDPDSERSDEMTMRVHVSPVE